MRGFTVMANSTDIPSLPSYELAPLPPLLWPIPDKLMILLLPIAGYWSLSMFFHWIDTMDYFPQYRLHTPAEVLKRNRVSRREVVRSVVIQQLVQTAVGWVLGMTEPDDFIGKERYDIAVWAQRIRIVQRYIPKAFAVLGIDTVRLGKDLVSALPMLSGAMMGGVYPTLQSVGDAGCSDPRFAPWELKLAWTIYYVLIPVFQFAVAIIVVDTWQYFLHRAMHMNKWLYTTFHAHHHRLYVPYAYGALYNHPFEGFLLDTLGATIAYKVAGMNTRQGMYFFTGSTFKTVDDHCGYALPFDPLQHITSNNAGYHDVHHQSWGIKSNFSQPFFTFWDRLLGTEWTGGDISARYERSRIAAQNALKMETQRQVIGSDSARSEKQSTDPRQDEVANASNLDDIQNFTEKPQTPGGKVQLQATALHQQSIDHEGHGGSRVLKDKAQEDIQAPKPLTHRSPRKRSTSALSKDGLMGLKGRMTGAGHGRTAGIIGVDGNR